MAHLARRPLSFVALVLAAACSGSPGGGGQDHAPAITAFTVPATAVVGTALPVSGAATDADGDAVSYAWTVDPAGCGAFDTPSAASTAFTPAVAGSCTVRLTATAGGRFDARARAVTVVGGCTGTACAPQHVYAHDPLEVTPPGGGVIWPSDTGSRAVLVEDRAPGAAGDILGLFYSSSPGGWYLLRSSDGGASFQYLAASNPAPNAAADAQPWSYSLAQDTSGYRVHVVWFGENATAARYSRIALTHDGGGHVSGWSWEAQNLAGPSFDTTASWMGFAKVEVKEIVDGQGNRLLAIVGMDQPSATRLQRLRLCRTAAGAGALAPSGATDWRKATDSAAPGCDLVAAYHSGAAADPADAAAFRNLTGESAQWMLEHTSDFTFAQQPADRSLHLFDGPMYYNDAFSSANPGEIRRWRLSSSGANWTLDGAVNGEVLATGDGQTRATLGSAYATPHHVWLVYGAPDGLHIDRSDAGSAWAANVVPSPDPSEHVWWWSALSVNADEARVYAYWETYAVNGSKLREQAGTFDGASWSITDVTGAFARDAAYVAGPQPGGDSWCPIQLAAGVGVMTYPYSQWLKPPAYHIHVLR